MADFNLKKPVQARRPPPPAEGFRQRTIPGLGTVPLKPGEVMVASELQDLIPLGWQPGDPVPPGLSDELARARSDAVADAASGQFRGAGNQPPPLRVPQSVPIESLPADKQAALRQMLADYRDSGAGTAAAPSPELAPGVAQAIRNAAAPPTGGFAVFDSRKASPPPATGPSPSVAAGVPPPVATEGGEGANPLKDCPHCGWDLALPAATEPSQSDKAGFVIAVLGGQPFVKEYSLFGGRLLVTLRQLLATGSDMVRQQLSADQRDGRILNLNDLLQLGADYRTALTLSTIRSDSGNTNVAKAVDELLADPSEIWGNGDATILPALVKQLKAQPALSAASAWNAIAACTERFNALVISLENRADSPDFWGAVGG